MKIYLNPTVIRIWRLVFYLTDSDYGLRGLCWIPLSMSVGGTGMLKRIS